MIKLSKKMSIVGIAVLVVIGVGGLVAGHLVVKRAAWQRLTERKTEREVQTKTYRLVDGWNFVAFPMEPVTIKTATELIEDVGETGGYVSMVSRWDGDRWQEVAQRGGEYYGTDFPIQAGEAYFIQNHQETVWTVVGLSTKANESYGTLQLKPGWNAVGLQPVSIVTAVDILDKTTSDGTEQADEIDQWTSGNWQVLVKRRYSENDIQEYGDNFSLSDIRGYMIRAYEPITINTVK